MEISIFEFRYFFLVMLSVVHTLPYQLPYGLHMDSYRSPRGDLSAVITNLIFIILLHTHFVSDLVVVSFKFLSFCINFFAYIFVYFILETKEKKKEDMND